MKPPILFLCQLALLAGLISSCVSYSPSATENAIQWTREELDLIQTLSLDKLPRLPESLGNKVADDEVAARFGQQLFFDQRLSGNGEVSCSTCHQPSRFFKDGLPRAQAIGETSRKTMTLVGSAWSSWLYWDGRRDSLWSQALSPLEDANEHGGTRTQYVHLISNHPDLKMQYERIFGALPDVAMRAQLPESAGPSGTPAEIAAWQAMSDTQRKLVNH